MTAADRINLLIRDADTQWPQSLGARTVFRVTNVSEDEAFGPSWPGLRPVDAEELWRAQAQQDTPANPKKLAETIAKNWSASLGRVELPDINPADKLVVAGPAAVVALAERFAGDDRLDWGDQVLCIASPPAHRQIAALATALTGTTQRAALIAAEDEPPKGPTRKRVVSDDASEDDSAVARSLS